MLGRLSPKEEPRETAAAGPASSQSSVPDSPQGGHWDCPSPFSLDTVPQSSVMDVMCLDLLGCEERSSSTGSAQPSLGTYPLSPVLHPCSSPGRAGSSGPLQLGPAYTQWPCGSDSLCTFLFSELILLCSPGWPQTSLYNLV